MATHQHATLEDTVFTWFGSNNTSGSGNDGASPAFAVRLAGATAGAAAVLTGTPTLLTHANYSAGSHEVEVAATAANGFAAGNTYAVFVTLLVDSQNPTGFAGSFTLAPIISDLTHIHGSALTETAGQLAAAFTKLFDVATPTLVASDVMRGTDSAALADKLLAYSQVTLRKDAAIGTDRATELLEINADEGSGAGTYANVTSSQDKLAEQISLQATAVAQTTAQNDLDIITGTDGTTLATTQGNYAPSKAGDAMALTAAAVDAILDEEVDNDGTAISLRGSCKLILSVLTGKSSGGGSNPLVFRDIVDSKNRISVTADANGNRTAVGTRDAT